MSFKSGVSIFVFAATAGLSLAITWSRRSVNKKSSKKSSVVQLSKSASPSKSADLLEGTIIDFNTFFGRRENAAAYSSECAKVAHALHNYGICIVRDPRVEDRHNDRFLDMMEKYFEGSDGARDARPEFHYQVGVTPEGVGTY